jgi:hypothetical protein
MAAENKVVREHKTRKLKLPLESSADEKTNEKKPNGLSVPEEKQSRINFFQRLAQMTEDDWSRCRVYVYRRWPRVSKDGQPHYIGVHREALDEAAIKALYGSGRYLCKLNNEKRTIDERGIEIMDLNSPPKLSADELMDCAENERYYKLWPPAPVIPKPADGANGNDAAVKELVGLLKTVVVDKGKSEPDDVKNTLIAWALQQAGKQSELNSPAAIANVITAIKDVLPNPAKENRSSEKSEILAVIAAFKDMQPRQQNPLEVLHQAKELFAPAAQTERNHLAELDQILGFAQKLASLRGGGGDRNSWDIALDFTKEIGGPVLQMINNFMGLRMGQSGAMQQPAPVGPAAGPPAAFDPYANQAALRSHAARMNAQAAAAPQSPQPSPAPPANAPPPPPNGAPPPAAPANGLLGANEIQPLLAQFGGLVLNALNSNTGGHYFARNVTELVGVGTHAMIAHHGEEVLVANMMAVPELAMFGEARLRRFAHEFTHFEELLANEEGEEDESEQESIRDRVTA